MKKMICVLLISALAFSLCACSSGKNEQPSQSSEPSTAESEKPSEDASESEASTVIDEGKLKTGKDDLTEEDIQALKDAIGRAVIAEYCEPNNIDPADFSWDVFTSSGGSGYFMWMDDLYGAIHDTGEYTVLVDDERVERVTVEEGADDTDKVTAAVCNGVIDYLNAQAPYNVGYLHSMSRIPGICDLVETIDLTALSE